MVAQLERILETDEADFLSTSSCTLNIQERGQCKAELGPNFSIFHALSQQLLNQVEPQLPHL